MSQIKYFSGGAERDEIEKIKKLKEIIIVLDSSLRHAAPLCIFGTKDNFSLYFDYKLLIFLTIVGDWQVSKLYFWLDPKVPIPRPRDKADEGMSAKATQEIIHAIRAVHWWISSALNC